ncbi:uncharacterized protein LOC113471813, partial [Diaphorina citri]|uniref:Uncharacterized protein LOC113471813 n=1 Tax=Diaphorina citri TaxID=121845 RepID=A0A3Q0JEX8_DIACI
FLISDLLYRQTVTINNSPLEVEIIDVSGETVSISCLYTLVSILSLVSIRMGDTVDESLGRSTAVKYNCTFHEVSVADNSPAIYQAFDHLRGGIHKIRKFSVTKMLGTLIGGSNKSPPTHQGGTVVVCNKSDLCRSRVLKRRQFLATPATSL